MEANPEVQMARFLYSLAHSIIMGLSQVAEYEPPACADPEYRLRVNSIREHKWPWNLCLIMAVYDVGAYLQHHRPSHYTYKKNGEKQYRNYEDLVRDLCKEEATINPKRTNSDTIWGNPELAVYDLAKKIYALVCDYGYCHIFNWADPPR